MYAGTCSWEWAFDNFGIYSIPPTPPLQITGLTASGGTATVNWNGTGANFSGLQKSASLNPAVWVNIPGTIGSTSYVLPASGAAGFYRAVKY